MKITIYNKFMRIDEHCDITTEFDEFFKEVIIKDIGNNEVQVTIKDVFNNDIIDNYTKSIYSTISISYVLCFFVKIKFHKIKRDYRLKKDLHDYELQPLKY